MSDDPEIIPPSKGSLPATREDRQSAPVRYESPPRVNGAVGSMITGFLARTQARAYRDIADNIRAQTEVLDAEAGRRDSQIKLLRKTGELQDVDEILALDRAERKAERTAKYGEIVAKYEKIDYDRDERAHQAELTKLRRERELKAAREANVDADRGVFNAEQGLENQKRLKQINLEIWEKRTQALDLKAEHIRNLLREELEGNKSEPSGGGLLDQLEALHTTLGNHVTELAADGLSDAAEHFRGLIGELDKILQAMRGK